VKKLNTRHDETQKPNRGKGVPDNGVPKDRPLHQLQTLLSYHQHYIIKLAMAKLLISSRLLKKQGRESKCKRTNIQNRRDMT
jgi:hypothetical protein